MMLVLFDADIVLEGVLGRSTFEVKAATDELWELMRSEQILGFITVIGLERIKIVLRHIQQPEEKIEKVIKSIQEIMEVCPVNENIWKEVQKLSNMKFEAAVELVCAQKSFVGVIVAKNTQDFLKTNFCVCSVDELVEILNKNPYYNEIRITKINLERLYNLSCEMSDNLLAGNENNTIHLNQWFANITDSHWKQIDELIEILWTPESNLSYRYIGANYFRDVGTITDTAIPRLIEVLQTSRDKLTRLQIVNLLGSIVREKKEAIAALTQLLNTVRDGDIRRQVAVNLQKIDPENNNAGVRRGKVINLGIEKNSVALVMTIMPEGRDKTNVHLRVYPIKEQIYLPPNLKLIVLDENKLTLLSIESGSMDNAVQLEFTDDPGDYFTVKVALGNVSVTENFVL